VQVGKDDSVEFRHCRDDKETEPAA
jgi:hypothetical protein